MQVLRGLKIGPGPRKEAVSGPFLGGGGEEVGQGQFHKVLVITGLQL